MTNKYHLICFIPTYSGGKSIIESFDTETKVSARMVLIEERWKDSGERSAGNIVFIVIDGTELQIIPKETTVVKSFDFKRPRDTTGWTRVMPGRPSESSDSFGP